MSAFSFDKTPRVFSLSPEELTRIGVEQSIRSITESQSEAAALAMANWGRGFLCALRCANLITDEQHREADAQIKSAQNGTLDMMQAIRRAHARGVA